MKMLTGSFFSEGKNMTIYIHYTDFNTHISTHRTDVNDKNNGRKIQENLTYENSAVL